MKKLISFMLVFVVLCLPAFAEEKIDFTNQPADLVGSWAIYIPYTFIGFGDVTIIFNLNYDGSMSSGISMNSAVEKDVFFKTNTGRWTAVDNYVIVQTGDEDKYSLLEKKDDLLWFSMSGGSFGLRKLPVPDVTQMKYPDLSGQ